MDRPSLVNQIKNNNIDSVFESCDSSCSLDLATWCNMLEDCNCDADYFRVFSLLPGLLKSGEPADAEVSALIERINFEIIGRMMISKESTLETSYSNLAMDILSVLLKNCPSNLFTKFQCLVKPLRCYVRLIRMKSLTVSEAENILCPFLNICYSQMDVADIENSLSFTTNTLKCKTDKLPSIILLKGITSLLKRLIDLRVHLNGGFNDKMWSENLRLVIKRILLTKYISKEYWIICFEIAALTVCIDAEWLGSDPDFLILLSTLTDVQLRLVLDDPQKIDIADLLPCLSLEKAIIRLADNEVILSEEQATKVSCICRESMNYVLTYLGECVANNIRLENDAEVAILNLVSLFLSIGGAHIIDSDILKKSTKFLADAAFSACERGDSVAVDFFIQNVAELPLLNETCILLFVNFLKHIKENSTSFIVSSDMILSVISQLGDRKDWYSQETLSKAKFIAMSLGDMDLNHALSSL